MSETYITGLAGFRAARSAAHRTAFRQGTLESWLAQGKIIDGVLSRDPTNTGDLDVLRAGLLMGKITASSKYAPAVLGVTTNAEAVGSTSIQASAAVVTELVRRIGATGTFKLIGPGAVGGVIVTETVTYSAASGVNITVTAIGNNFIAGSFLAPTDGSEDPLTLVSDGYGVKVTDADNANIDVPFAEMPIAGVITSTQLLPVWPTDASLREWIVSRLSRASGGKFVFDHLY